VDDVIRNRRQATSAALTLGLVGFMVGTARAQDPAPPIALGVDVPPECPSDLAVQILSRTPRTRLAGPGEPARRVGVRIVSEEGRYRGAVGLDGLDGEPVVRHVEGPSCDEVTAALALIAALAIDPEANMTPVAPVLPPAPIAPLPPPAPPPPLPRDPEALEVLPAIEVGFGVASGLAPRAIPGGALMLELGMPKKEPLFLVRAGASFWSNGQIAVERDDGTANAAAVYRAILARVEACVALRVERFSAAPCATFDVGSLSVQGSEDGVITEGLEASQLWAAPGPALRLGWNFAGPFTLALDGALTFPLQRDTYAFEQPPQVAHDVPAVAARAGAYVGLHFR
jgi:hypothetical protein